MMNQNLPWKAVSSDPKKGRKEGSGKSDTKIYEWTCDMANQTTSAG